MTTINSFIYRLKKIVVEIISNYPWVYLDKVNGKKVNGLFEGNHGFTCFFRAIRQGEPDKITDVKLIFDKIRETLK